MLEDLTKTIKAQLYERASSPLLASFALSWVAYNYRFVIVLVSSMTAHEKFQYIDNHLYQGFKEIALRGVLYPLLTSLFLIFIYPIPAKFVYEHWRKRHRELKEIQQRIDDETPLTKEDAREIRREAIKATAEYERELERRGIEVSRLKELISDLERRLTDSTLTLPPDPTPQDQSDPPLDDNQIKMLKRVAESSTPISENTLISYAGTDRVHSEYNLGELERRGFVSISYTGGLQPDHLVKATHSGRSNLVSLLRDSSADIE